MSENLDQADQPFMLNRAERLIIMSRHIGPREATYESLGRALGLTPEQVRTTEVNLLFRLRDQIDADYQAHQAQSRQPQ